MPVRYGIVGCGAIAQRRHIPECVNNPDSSLVALCDPNYERAEGISKAYGGVAKCYTDYAEMLKDPNVDAVVVSGPNKLHAEQSIQALAAGKHVLCEKPMATTREDAKAMIAASEKAGKYLMIGLNQRLMSPHRRAKEILDSGRLGKVLAFRTAFQHPGTPRERIHRVIGAYLEHLAQERDFPRLIQRALLNNDPHLRRVANEYLHPLVDILRPFVGRRSTTALGNLEEIIVSVFGAIIAPFLYEPLLADLFRRDVMSPAALKRRRRHIEALVELTLAQILPPEA